MYDWILGKWQVFADCYWAKNTIPNYKAVHISIFREKESQDYIVYLKPYSKQNPHEPFFQFTNILCSFLPVVSLCTCCSFNQTCFPFKLDDYRDYDANQNILITKGDAKNYNLYNIEMIIDC